MDEFDLIEALRVRFTSGLLAQAPTIDIGDDAAVLPSDARPLVLSVDASVEGVHFDRRFACAEDIGYRALMAAASDLAAMGADPQVALLALTIAQGAETSWLLALADGVAEAARECGLRVVGGNVSRARDTSLTTTVTGHVPTDRQALCRSGAQLGDDLYVSGAVGLAALGLATLQAGAQASSEASLRAVSHWRRPRARISLGQALRDLATSAVDLSDGLLQDVAHLARASGVGIEISLPALPTVPGFHAACEALGKSGDDLALAGGEDYQLAFTAPPARRAQLDALAAELVRVGRVVPEPGLRVLDGSGEPRSLAELTGFRHRW